MGIEIGNLKGVKVQQIGAAQDSSFLIKVQGDEKSLNAASANVQQILGKELKPGEFEIQRVDVVGPAAGVPAGHANQAPPCLGKQRRDHARVGSNHPIKVNVRILSATNRNLEDSYRGRHVPQRPVSSVESRDDSSADARRAEPGHSNLDRLFHPRQFAARHGKQIRGMSPAARRKLLSFDWPGNVRQLRNVVESMVVVDYDGLLDVDDLPEEFSAPAEPAGDSSPASLTALVGRPLTELEKLFVSETLRLTAGNREEAAKMLGIGERTLYRKIKEFGL